VTCCVPAALCQVAVVVGGGLLAIAVSSHHSVMCVTWGETGDREKFRKYNRNVM
jgi:hypothetical protein